MQVSVKHTGSLERRVTVQVPEAEIQQKVDERLKELSKQVKIKGFRPGRVPMSVVRQRYAKQVRAEIANEVMQSSVQQVIREQKLRPASTPQVADLPDDLTKGDLTFSAVLEVYPDFEPLDISSLEVEKPNAQVTDADVDEMLNTLREQRRSWKPVDKSPQAGEQVLFEYAAETDSARVPSEGFKRLAIIFGASGFASLESALSGLKAGDTAKVELEFPENFLETELAGKTAHVELKVTTVSESMLPEIDEDFIKSFGIQDGTVETLRTEVRANLERELRQAVTSILKVRIVEALVATAPDLAVPETIVRQEAASLASRVARSEGREPQPEDTTAFMGKAENRVRGGLMLGEVARQNNIRVDASRVRQAIETIAQTYEDPAEVVQLYYGNKQLLAQVENSAMEEQVVDWVMENAKVSLREMKFQEVISGASSVNR